MVLKWTEKKPMSFISDFTGHHGGSFEEREKLNKPRPIQEFNSFMRGVDLNYQKVQP
jgi:hypothetical protein